MKMKTKLTVSLAIVITTLTLAILLVGINPQTATALETEYPVIIVEKTYQTSRMFGVTQLCLDASKSYNPMGGELTYQWDFDSVTESPTSSDSDGLGMQSYVVYNCRRRGPTFDKTYAFEGEWQVELTIFNEDGKTTIYQIDDILNWNGM